MFYNYFFLKLTFAICLFYCWEISIPVDLCDRRTGWYKKLNTPSRRFIIFRSSLAFGTHSFSWIYKNANNITAECKFYLPQLGGLYSVLCLAKCFRRRQQYCAVVQARRPFWRQRWLFYNQRCRQNSRLIIETIFSSNVIYPRREKTTLKENITIVSKLLYNKICHLYPWKVFMIVIKSGTLVIVIGIIIIIFLIKFGKSWKVSIVIRLNRWMKITG